jgi:L-phenylalanine/L-methionine N-acetyltransferase
MTDQLPQNSVDRPGVIVRPVRVNDAPAVHAIATDPYVGSTLTLSPAMELPVTEGWLKTASDYSHRLVAEVDGRVAGMVTLDQRKNPRLAHSGGLGLMIGHDFWGQGIGKRLMAAVLDLADNWLNLKRVELDVFCNNPAAVHLYRKFGFETEGTCRCVTFQGGQWRDEFHMARLRGVGDLETPGEPVEIPAAPPRRQPPADLVIRPLHPADVEALYAMWSHPAVARTTLRMPSMEMAAAEKRVSDRRTNRHRLVAVTGGQVVGVVTIEQPELPRLMQSAGLGMMIHPDYWGLGIGSRLLAAIIDLADNWLHLKRIELDVNVDNPAGVRLYEKHGFTIEGRKRFHAYGDGRWTDSYFMAHIR